MFELENEGGPSLSRDSCADADVAGGPDSTDAAAARKATDEIELSRRAVPVVEIEKDICSICLEGFDEDVAVPTQCGCVLSPLHQVGRKLSSCKPAGFRTRA